MSQKLEKRFTFRLTKKEYQELEATAQILGCNPSDAARMGARSINMAAKELASAK